VESNLSAEAAPAPARKVNLDEVLGLISEAEYAQFVGKTLGTVRNDRSAGKCPPYVKDGNMIKYPIEGIRKFLEARIVAPGASRTLTAGGLLTKHSGAAKSPRNGSLPAVRQK
jgi:hypothetical protein